MVANVTQRTPMAYEPGRVAARPDLAVAAPTVSADGKTVTRQAPRRRALLAAGQARGDQRRRQVRDRARLLRLRQQPVRARVLRRRGRREARRQAGHDDLRHLDAGRAHGRVQAAPRDRRHAGGRAGAAAGRAGAARVRAAARPREGLRVRRSSRSRPARTWSAAYEPGKNITLVRNPSWNAKTDFRPAYLDRIEMPQGNDDPIIASRRILKGSHMASGDYMIPPAVLKQAFTKTPEQLELVDSGGGRWAALNTQVAPFDNVNVRKAVRRRLRPPGRADGAGRQERRHRRHPLPAAGHARLRSGRWREGHRRRLPRQAHGRSRPWRRTT